MRVTTDFWASALVRRVFGHGGFAAIVRRGATEAGSTFVTVRNRLGEVTLYGPASQTSYDSARPTDRLFALLIANGDADAIDARLAKEERFDSDIWVLDIEPGSEPIEDLLGLEKNA